MAGRTQQLCFHGLEGETVGSLILDGGMIRFGVEFVGGPYLDATFSRGALPYSLPLIKLLHGEKLTRDESHLLAKLPLHARRATRAVTARALRLLASLCDLSQPPTVLTDVGSQLSHSALHISFSPLELMLAAGTTGDIRYEDAAASEYELPPGNPKERWLFEWHGDKQRALWPVMTTRVSERKVSAVVAIGQFGQRLVGSLEQLVPMSGRGERTAALITTGEQIHYIVQTERYVALLTYGLEQGARLRATLDNMAERGKGLSAHISNSSDLAGASSISSISNISPITSASSISGASSISNVPSASSVSGGSGPVVTAAAEQPAAQVAPAAPATGATAEGLDSVSAGWLELQETARDLARPASVSASSPPVAALTQLTKESGEVSPAPPEAQHQTTEPTEPISQNGRPREEDSDAAHNPGPQSTENAMALTSNTIKDLLTKLETGIDGFIGAAVADSESGMCLGATGGGGVMNLEVAAASNTEVVRAKRKAIKTLGLRDEIEDILITLGKQYHLIRPLRSRSAVFIYIALDRTRANLGLARFTLTEAEREIVG